MRDGDTATESQRLPRTSCGIIRPLSRRGGPTNLPRMSRYSGPIRALLLLLFLVFVAGCGKLFQRDDPLETLPVEAMYEEAKGSLMGGNHGRAARYYKRLIARFPYGPYTEQAQLELAYSQYKANDADEALATINRFIRTYPTHRHVAYAYYLRALVNFERDNTFLDRMARIDQTMRDQTAVFTSFDDFAELIRRYPNSRYAADARLRMVYLRNQMARHEMNVARYYLRRGAWVAAAKRGQYVLEHYPQSGHVPDALAVMAESYTRLGQEDLAADARRVLQQNDPDHPWLRGDWPESGGFWKRLLPLGES